MKIEFSDGLLTWTDEDSGLMWEVKNPENFDLMYFWHSNNVRLLEEDFVSRHEIKQEKGVKDCTSYIKKLNSSAYAGFSDWRLPTLTELETLIDKNSDSIFIKEPLIKNTRPAYWTDTPAFTVNVFKQPLANIKDTAHISSVKIVDFLKPMIANYDPRNTLWIRCVRNVNN